jgi:hypothetical protein
MRSVLKPLSTMTVALAGLLFLSGCGSDGPPRYHMSGKVTHGGKPIPAGSVMFVPDTNQGNSGPATSVEIREGEFDTKWAGTGHVGGPHRVTVTALDGQESDEFSAGMPLFPDYELELDLPKEKATQDLDVPADWIAEKPKSNAPMSHGP